MLIVGIYVLLGTFIDPVSKMLITLPVTFPLAPDGVRGDVLIG